MSLARLTDIAEKHMSRIQFARATGAAAVAMTVAPAVKWALREVRIHLSAAGGAGNLTITVDSGTNAVYDTILLTQDMTAIADLAWQPDFPMIFDANDEIDIAWANAGKKTYGIEVVYSEV